MAPSPSGDIYTDDDERLRHNRGRAFQRQRKALRPSKSTAQRVSSVPPAQISWKKRQRTHLSLRRISNNGLHSFTCISLSQSIAQPFPYSKKACRRVSRTFTAIWRINEKIAPFIRKCSQSISFWDYSRRWHEIRVYRIAGPQTSSTALRSIRKAAFGMGAPKLQ